jgi:predicted DCC family thiol-disulfide oxidoreductase YuxK
MEQTITTDWILYDDTCGFCREWVPFWGNTLRKNGFEIAPLQSEWVARSLHLSADELTQDLRLLLKEGGQIFGADVYRYVMRRIWWAYPFYLLSVAPISRNIFNWGYRTFANNRYRISGKCSLPKTVRR